MPTHLLASYNTYHIATQLIDEMRGSYQAEGSKLVLAKKAKTVYDQAIKVAWQVHNFWQNANTKSKMEKAYETLQQLNKEQTLPKPNEALQNAFGYSEKSKAVLLFTAIKERHAQQTANIPQALRNEEYNLRIEINYLKKRITEEQYKNPDERNETDLLHWKSRRFDYKQQYAALLKRFETNFPDYYLLKYQTQSVSILQLQTALPKSTALLQYFVGKDFIYLFVVTSLKLPNTNKLPIVAYQIPKPAQFEVEVAAFGKHLEKFNNRQYTKLAYSLYQLLLQNALQQLPANAIDTLLIIPDGVLTKLPFEALLTQATSTSGNYTAYPYLLLQYHVQYHHSATLWYYYHNRISPTSTVMDSGFIGFAPVYTDKVAEKQAPKLHQKPDDTPNLPATNNYDASKTGTNYYPALPESALELQNISHIFEQKTLPNQIFLHKLATLPNFTQNAPKYKYIHIAAHSDYNDQQPELTGIIFSPNEQGKHHILYLNDTFQLQLHADLLVLSCCETGLGQQKEGEGMMALNRGFLYAGVQNIIYTLFKVLDKPSSQLTQLLYKYILAGLPYKKAVREAKLSMIQNQHPPSYWSGFVLMGK